VAWVPNTGQRIRRALFRWATPVYLGTLAAGTAILSGTAMAYAASHGWRAGALLVVLLLTIVPASEATIQIVQRILSYLIPPRRLPRLELDRIPDDARTMVIVPTILESVERVRELIDHIEVQAAGNTDPHLHFAILSDWGDAATETQPADAAILEAAREGIEALNAKAEGSTSRFFLFHRARQWNEQQGLWMGWERKRGKIEEFNRVLRGATDTSFVFHVGDLLVLPQVRYCITLDSDTRLPRDAARELVGIITHPLNRPTIDPRIGRVTEGYGILQPRVSVTFMSAAGSLFARLYAGHTGVDPYTTAVSDTYQDLFGEGIFTGKGLYDVDAFMASLADNVPENALLSHDLFEGVHARAALVSDVELVDDYPSSVLTHARRQHRWIRGDWQILLWLFPFVPTRHGLKRNTLPLISRWKILDNLRRSLVPPMLLAMLVAGWTFLPGSAWFWTGAAWGVIASQLLPLIARFVAGPSRLQSRAVFLRNLQHDTATTLAQILLGATFLVFHAFDSVHAISLTLVRMVFTKRRLLEWETAAATARRLIGLNGQSGLRRFAGEMVGSPALAGFVLVLVAFRRPAALLAALPFLVLWAIAPIVAYWLSVPVGPRVRPLSDAQRRALRRTARKTWRYFETFATESDGWLPPGQLPGNRQRPAGPAHLADEHRDGAALDAGRARSGIPLHARPDRAPRRDVDHARRAGAPRGALPQLVRHRYAGAAAPALRVDGRQRQSRRGPQYARPGAPPDRLAAAVTGTAPLRPVRRGGPPRGGQRHEPCGSRPRDRDPHQRARPRDRRQGTKRRPGDQPRVVRRAARRGGRARARRRTRPEAADTAFWSGAVLSGLAALRPQHDIPDDVLQALAARAAALADAIRFDFLYDRHRRIFSIGYRLADVEGPGRLDSAYYDLLASEARLASFVAIAKGDVPQHHWFHLGRPVTNIEGRATLMSWGGTQFEYLMPLLLMRTFPGHAARSELRGERPAADAVRAASAASRGACPSRPTRSPTSPATISTGPSACRGSD
jgi:cellulose synthase/poly-beta-1,6-N-acetylglucosamine synthase-like glycosyltransferase